MQHVHFQIFSLSTLSLGVLQLLCCTCKDAAYSIQWKISIKKRLMHRVHSRWYHKVFVPKMSTHIYCKPFTCRVNGEADNTIEMFSNRDKDVGRIYIHRISILCRIQTDFTVAVPQEVYGFSYIGIKIANLTQCNDGYIFHIYVNRYTLMYQSRKYEIKLFDQRPEPNIFTHIIVCANTQPKQIKKCRTM